MSMMSIQEAFGAGVQFHQAGRLAEAEQLYRQILAQQPNHADALHLLGVIASQVGRNDASVDLIRRAISILPNFAEAYGNLGKVLKDMGRFDEAIAAYRQAIALKPNNPVAQSYLGNALLAKGQLDDAAAAYRQAIALNGDYAEAHNNLGNTLVAKGQLAEAIAAFGRAIAINSSFAEAQCNLGGALKDNGQFDKAIAACRAAIALKPDLPGAFSNLGNALEAKGQTDEAIAAYHTALALKPDLPEVHSNLGNVLREKGLLEEAITAFRRAIALCADYAEAYSNLGYALTLTGQTDEAVVACRAAIALNANFAQAFVNLGFALLGNGQADEAIVAYRQAIAIKPNCVEGHSNLLFCMHYNPGYDARMIADEHRGWNRSQVEPLTRCIEPHLNDRNPDRRLRIGYVSPDFREHVVARFLLPLLAKHDKSKVEVFAYADASINDAMTQRLQEFSDCWRNIVGLSDVHAADLIRQDRIDLLVDLSMHTAHNRMLVFARKPAPVQVTYLAYCSTTGLETIDYRLSDRYFDPPGIDESIYSEKTIRLPETYWCYEPPVTTPAVAPLPLLERGFITFGSLNNFCKMNNPMLAVWAKLLRAAPNSRLLLHANEGSQRRRVHDELEREGIERDRVQFVGRVSMEAYFGLYGQIDIALDTFPYGGGTTTCDALWMGAPVVTLVGKLAVGRGGLSLLSNIGLAELVAHSEDAYVRIASELARDLPRLKMMRSTLRQRMAASALMDAPKFARNIEAAYREMWRTWAGNETSDARGT